MKKMQSAIALTLLFALSGCKSTTAGQIPEGYAAAQEMQLDFEFGTRSGTYTGQINGEGLPDGIGFFSSQTENGLGWTYSGHWNNGHFGAVGTTIYANGSYYSGEHLMDSQSGIAVSRSQDTIYHGTFLQGNLIGNGMMENIGEEEAFFGVFMGDGTATGAMYSVYGTTSPATVEDNIIKIADRNESSSENTEPTVSATDEPAIQWRGASTYKVGVDLPAGEYCLQAGPSTTGYYCISSDSLGEDILANENFQNYQFVTVEDGQYFEVSRANFTESANISGFADKTQLVECMYRVGIDIPAGEYKLQSAEGTSGYYCIYDTSAASKKIQSNSNFEGAKYVSVANGQYLELTRCTGSIVE